MNIQVSERKRDRERERESERERERERERGRYTLIDIARTHKNSNMQTPVMHLKKIKTALNTCTVAKQTWHMALSTQGFALASIESVCCRLP